MWASDYAGDPTVFGNFKCPDVLTEAIVRNVRYVLLMTRMSSWIEYAKELLIFVAQFHGTQWLHSLSRYRGGPSCDCAVLWKRAGSIDKRGTKPIASIMITPCGYSSGNTSHCSFQDIIIASGGSGALDIALTGLLNAGTFTPFASHHEKIWLV